MAFKQQHKTDESTTNDIKLFRNCDSGEENHKHNSETPTETAPLLQYAERPLLNFRQGRYVPPQSKILTSGMALNTWGDTSLKEANGDVQLDGVAFSRLD